MAKGQDTFTPISAVVSIFFSLFNEIDLNRRFETLNDF
jgi:hypothetical protein